jgi:hypothetical protein
MNKIVVHTLFALAKYFIMEELIKKAEGKRIEVEHLIISAKSKEDPQGGIKLRLKLAKKYWQRRKNN